MFGSKDGQELRPQRLILSHLPGRRRVTGWPEMDCQRSPINAPPKSGYYVGGLDEEHSSKTAGICSHGEHLLIQTLPT